MSDSDHERLKDFEKLVATQGRVIEGFREVMFAAADLANDAGADSENGLRERLSIIAKALYGALEKPDRPEPPTLKLV